MNLLPLEIQKLRSLFIYHVRRFFYENNFFEIDTPFLKKTPGMEPYLDPFLVSSPATKNEGYLITSPEYSLKEVLSLGFEKIFEIAHAFRSGEKGEFHTKEFLMLEFYISKIDEQRMILFCIQFFQYLNEHFKNIGFDHIHIDSISMEELFFQKTGRGFSKDELIQTILENRFQTKEVAEKSYYDELFFLVFLNCIERNLPNSLVFIYDYPPELSSLAKIENGKSKRFEIYWNQIEIGNAFYELTDPHEQKNRLEEEKRKRKELGKDVFEIDQGLIRALENGIEDCSGISIGLDRLFMIFLNHKNLRFISPYYQSPPESPPKSLSKDPESPEE